MLNICMDRNAKLDTIQIQSHGQVIWLIILLQNKIIILNNLLCTSYGGTSVLYTLMEETCTLHPYGGRSVLYTLISEASNLAVAYCKQINATGFWHLPLHLLARQMSIYSSLAHTLHLQFIIDLFCWSSKLQIFATTPKMVISSPVIRKIRTVHPYVGRSVLYTIIEESVLYTLIDWEYIVYRYRER